MKVSEAIEKLTVKRDDALHFQKLYKPGNVGWTANESKAIAYSTAINVLQQIDEPQAEKVEVPDFVAEWYETNKASIERAVSMQIQHGFTPLIEPRSKFDMWFFDERNHPIETIIRMKDGYTVKPKRWVVKFEQQNEQFYFMNWIDLYSMEPVGYAKKDMGSVMKFTDIKKAEALATLIDGEVEEA
ncbi:DUF1642 domain-containing protein [Enterococcus asini]|uniref:DUF1642 domain-containing protein n=1 Tax=Enterococcus asini TaxID=57732 RepID=UPI001E533C67|nr:DUF1642 domain-containing protein [Enterococcus asini]MCD5029090.1 DUF1642 domain-containing protein [Enterococcus asini]